MPGPDPATAAVRAAVRRALAPLARPVCPPTAQDASAFPPAVRDASASPPTAQDASVSPPTAPPAPDSCAPLVLVACSGGPDSLALAAATAFVAPRLGLRAGAVVVDHGLQPDSERVARRAAEACRGLGLDPVEVRAVRPGRSGGPEAGARAARYEALEGVAADRGARVVLLGHTLDDQAETVLLGLARGSGARSLAGMPARRGMLCRPLLGVRRAQTEAVCAAAGLTPWQDPTNTLPPGADPAVFPLRSRLRALMPALEEALGPGVAPALARTADALAEDAEVLQDQAERLLRAVSRPSPRGVDGAVQPVGVDARALASHPAALRRRALHGAALRAGVPPGAVTRRHVSALDALVVDWHGQGPVHLPGRRRARRVCGTLVFLDADEGRPTAPHSPETSPDGLPPFGTPDGPSPFGSPLETQVSSPEKEHGRVDAIDMGSKLEKILLDGQQIDDRLGEMAEAIDADYAGRDLLLVGVLKGAVMVMADLSRKLHTPVEMDWMAVSSYGSGTKSSGVVRILKDLEIDLHDRNVLVVEDIVDSGLTLSWLLQNLRSRGAASVEVAALLRKPDAAKVEVDVRYVGFDIPNEFVVGYGLDYAEAYRTLPFVGTLASHVYSS